MYPGCIQGPASGISENRTTLAFLHVPPKNSITAIRCSHNLESQRCSMQQELVWFGRTWPMTGAGKLCIMC